MNYRSYFSHRLPPQTGILPHPGAGSHVQRHNPLPIARLFHNKFKYLMEIHIAIGTQSSHIASITAIHIGRPGLHELAPSPLIKRIFYLFTRIQPPLLFGRHYGQIRQHDIAQLVFNIFAR